MAEKNTGLGLYLRAKVSINDRPSYFQSYSGFFPAGAKKNCPAFCTIRLDVVLQSMSAEFFAQKIQDLTCLFNIKQNLAINRILH